MRAKFSYLALSFIVPLFLLIFNTPAMGTMLQYKGMGETFTDNVPVTLYFEYDTQGDNFFQPDVMTELIVGTEDYYSTTGSFVVWDIMGPDFDVIGSGSDWTFFVEFWPSPPPEQSGLNNPLALDYFGSSGYAEIISPEYSDYFVINQLVRLPEPATMLLLGLGLLGIMGLSKKFSRE